MFVTKQALKFWFENIETFYVFVNDFFYNNLFEVIMYFYRKPRSGSFRGRRSVGEKRITGPSKSHSDPDKNKVETAVFRHK